MMDSSSRHSDMAFERLLSGYLRKYFYPELLRRFPLISDLVVHEARDEQLSGKDTSFVWKDKGRFFIDEKAQSHYINHPLPTFAFELSSLQDDRVVPGWFINDDLDTRIYLLVWITKAISDDWRENTQIDDIRSVDISHVC